MTCSYLFRLLEAALLLPLPPEPLFPDAAEGAAAGGEAAAAAAAELELELPAELVFTTSKGTMLTRRCCRRRRTMRGINFSATHIRSDGGLAGRDAP